MSSFSIPKMNPKLTAFFMVVWVVAISNGAGSLSSYSFSDLVTSDFEIDSFASIAYSIIYTLSFQSVVGCFSARCHKYSTPCENAEVTSSCLVTRDAML